MTRKEFEVFRLRIDRQKFVPKSFEVVTLAIERNAFQRARLEKLLEAAGTVTGSKTIDRLIPRWRRKLARLQSQQTRWLKVKQEAQAAKLEVRPVPLRPINKKSSNSMPSSISIT